MDRFNILTVDNRTLLKEQGRAIFTPSQIERESKAFSVQQNFRLSADEGVYGLGQQQLGVMNYRGRTVKIVQANKGGYTCSGFDRGIWNLLDNYSKTIFDDSRGKTSFWSEVADNIDYYFFYGPTIDQEIADTGTHRRGAHVRQVGLRLLAKQGISPRATNCWALRGNTAGAGFPSITWYRTRIIGAITITGEE